MGKRLYVGNLSFSITEADLREAFKAEGHDVAEVKLVPIGKPGGRVALPSWKWPPTKGLSTLSAASTVATCRVARSPSARRASEPAVAAAEVERVAAARAGAGKRSHEVASAPWLTGLCPR